MALSTLHYKKYGRIAIALSRSINVVPKEKEPKFLICRVGHPEKCSSKRLGCSVNSEKTFRKGHLWSVICLPKIQKVYLGKLRQSVLHSL